MRVARPVPEGTLTARFFHTIHFSVDRGNKAIDKTNMNAFIQLLSGRLIRLRDIHEVRPTGPDKSDLQEGHTTYHGVKIYYRKRETIHKFVDAAARDAYMQFLLTQLNPSSNKPDRLTKEVSGSSDAS